MDRQQIDAALEACYDAVVDPERWSDALHRLARSLGAVCCMFYPQYPGQTLLRMPASPDFKDFLDEFVRDGWWLDDHRADRGWPMFNAGETVVLEEEVASEDERQRLPAYNEFYPRYDVPWWAGLAFRASGRQWVIPLLRSSGQGAFTRAEGAMMETIVPHLRRMISISEKLTLGRVHTSLDLIDSMSTAALALDWQGRVVRVNRHAETLLGDGVALSGGRLHAHDRESDRRLQRLLTATTALDAADFSSEAAAVLAQPVAIRRVGRRPLLAEAMPAGSCFGDVLCQAHALVFLTDLAKPSLAKPDRIAAILGLTSAEGRLAAELVEGRELADAAERLGVSIHTARSQLKCVFAKTGTHRQAELVALAGRIAKGQ
jgi:DNA-binding CsgD family transcriptional regulator/PAS domain-containing protein